MALRIYNTLKRSEEDFKPLVDKKVKMYVCGPTVYDVLHVGNFRGVIFFNLVRNWLAHLGYTVTYVYNYTDVDDKIINRAKEEGKKPEEISAQYIGEYEKDFAALKLAAHDHNPRATEYIDKMVEAVQALIDNEKAYVVEGEVFFAVDSFCNYGKLSNKNLDELQVGHRVEADPTKKNPLDFVLWKPSKDGEPSWKSPWGNGRPGWHIECSVMSKSLLGDSIDIHGGGIDLIFPHHENEIAQSEGLSGQTFAKYWMHNNFVNFGDTKMSKSLGNVITGRALLEQYNAEIFKYLVLSVHYRSPLNLADTQIQQAIAALARVYAALAAADEIIGSETQEGTMSEKFPFLLNKLQPELEVAMNNDFNTPAVFAIVFDVVRAFNALCDKNKKMTEALKAQAVSFKGFVLKFGELMSLFQEPAKDFLAELDQILIREKGLDVEEIERKVQQRVKARENKDFQSADAIRDELNALGVEVKDNAQGSTWEVKKGS